MTVTCPGCQTELDPSNTNCPVCLRPRSRKEILAGLSGTRRPAPTRWGRLLLGLVLLGGLGYAGQRLWQMPAPPPPPPEPAAPAPAAPVPAPAPEAQAPAPAPDGAPRPTATVASPAPKLQPSSGEEDASPAKKRRRAAPKPSGWKVEGQVYDLFSLKPLPNTRIVFQDKNTGDAHSASTDGKGRYALYLPKVRDGGYEVTVARRGYSDTFLEEMAPPYRSQSAQRRQEAADQLSESAVLHVPLLPEYEAEAVPYDLILFPRQ